MEEVKICCTCLSKDRFLYPSSQYTVSLATINLEINTNLGGICWECKRMIERLTKFRTQVVEAQQLLSSCIKIDKLKSYSALAFSKKYFYDTHFDPTTNVQITCTETGPILIKQEITETDEQLKDGSQLNREDNIDSNNVLQKSNELPRITLVESITEQACDRNERFQPITEIIELNIPIPQLVLSGYGQKEREHTDRVGGTEVAAKESLKETNCVIEKNIPFCDGAKNSDQTGKETITVQLKLVTEDGTDVKIKEEPLYDDDDDVQVEDNDFISTDDTENCSTEYRNESPKNKTNDKQDDIWKRSVMLVYNRLRGHKYADRFAYPITDAVAPEYSKVVKSPMDLNTIRRNIRNGVVRTTAQFQRDLLLMFTNALMYNHSEHSVHIMARDFLTEVQYQLDMLQAVHAQKTLSDDTPSQRSRRRRESKCCTDAHIPAKRPRLSTTPKSPKSNKEIRTEKSKAKTSSPKNFLTPVKVENIHNIEKYTSHLENTDIRRSRRKSISVIKYNSSKANKNNSLVAAKVDSVIEKETKKRRKPCSAQHLECCKLDMLQAVHAQKTLSDDTPSQRSRRRRESKCCTDAHIPAKRPRLSTTPKSPKSNKEIRTEKSKAKTSSPKNFLTPVKVENIHNIEKYTSHLENTDIRRSRRKSISVIKYNSSKANKNNSLVAAKVDSVIEKETKKRRKSCSAQHLENTDIRRSRRKSISVIKYNSSKANKNNSLVAAKVDSVIEKETKKRRKSCSAQHLENTDIRRSRRKSISVIKYNSSKANKNNSLVAAKVDSVIEKETKKRRKSCSAATFNVQTEAIMATKISSRRNTLRGKQKIPLEVENVVQHSKDVKSKTSRNIKEELIAHTPQPKKRRKSVKQDNIRDDLDSAYMDDIIIENRNEIASDELCVAIANANQRDMITVQAQNVKRTLEDRILNLALDSRYFAPRFKGKPIIVDGVIKLWCECKKTLSWLSNTVDKMPRKYGRFVVRKQSELPKKVKSALLIPGFNQVDFIMRWLKAQNSGVFVDSWVVYSAEQRGENMFLVLGIPTAAIPKLSSRGFKLAYNLGSVTIKFYNANGNLVGTPPQ